MCMYKYGDAASITRHLSPGIYDPASMTQRVRDYGNGEFQILGLREVSQQIPGTLEVFPFVSAECWSSGPPLRAWKGGVAAVSSKFG